MVWCWIDLRRGQTLMLGEVRPGAADALRRLSDTGESGGRPLSARADGLAGENVPVLTEEDETDVLLWLGDGAYELRYARTLRALVKLLRLADVKFAILGEAELDCGDRSSMTAPVWWAGRDRKPGYPFSNCWKKLPPGWREDARFPASPPDVRMHAFMPRDRWRIWIFQSPCLSIPGL